VTPGVADEIGTLRTEVERADTDVSQAAAVRSAVRDLEDRMARGGATDTLREAAVEAVARYLGGEGRREELSYLTDPLVPADSGGTVSALDATLSPEESNVRDLAEDLRTHVTGGSVGVDDLTGRVETIVFDGTESEVASLASLADRLLRAAKGLREDRTAALNETGWTDADGEDVGATAAFLEEVGDEVAAVPDQPIALFPVRLETRFVTPNDERPDRITDTVANAERAVINRTDPGEAELRVRVYPDQVHTDTHEPELTDDEEAWGRNFWAQLWFACFETRVVNPPEDDTGPIPMLFYDQDKRDMVPDDDTIHGTLEDLSDRRAKFSRAGAAFHEEVKERAWRGIVDRFGRERGAYVVHSLAPTDRATDILAGWTGEDDGTPPWPRSDPAGEPSPDAPDLSFPEVDRRPDSWNQPPTARLLPDRWLLLGEWRPADSPDAETTTMRTESGAVRDPLYVGPNPEAVAEDELEETEGDAPEGMEWMTDYESAREAGMAITITAEDLDDTDPRDVVFEQLLVLGVSASRDGASSTDEIRSAFEAHHYTDGLEFLDRGTPTNNHDLDSGYRRRDDPAESMATEVDAPLVSFGDFSDGDIVSRALGIADPGGDHVFAHVEGADGTTQANARHMNSLLWPGTIGYYLRNVAVSNRWTDLDSIWSGIEGISPESFPENPMAALGEGLKWTDAMRRHFVRYVRAGGPFPPIRVGRQPYGLLPVATMPDDDGGGISWDGPLLTGESDVGDSVYTGEGVVGTGSGDVPVTDDDLVIETGDEPVTDDVVKTGATDDSASDGVAGKVSKSGYGVYAEESLRTVNEGLYGSSYDPAGPASLAVSSKSLTTSDDLTLSEGDDSTRPDGGILGEATYVRPRYFRRDEDIPGKIASLLRKLTPAWRAAVGNVDAATGNDPADVIERILAREATADEYVDEVVNGWDEQREAMGDRAARAYVQGQLREVRRSLQDHDMTDLDPRLGWMFPPPALDWDIARSGTRGRERDIDEGDIPWLVDTRAPEYLDELVTPRYGSGHDQLEALEQMGYNFEFDSITVDRDTLRNVEGVRLPTNLDEASDAQVALLLTLTAEDHGKLGEMFSRGVFGLDTDSAEELTTHALKGYQLVESDGLTLLQTLFKQLTRFSLLQGYVGARIRLGTMFDEDLFPQDGGGLLGAGVGQGGQGPTQEPVPEPSAVTENTRSMWEALRDHPPTSAPVADDSYVDLFWDTCRPGTGTPPIDPRLGEVFDSLAHLRTLDAETLGRLMAETLDVASYRLDAWRTSLATRRLYEQRERQEAAMYAGEDYDYVGSHFAGAPGVAGQTPAERARETTPAVGGSGFTVNEDGRVVATDTDESDRTYDLGTVDGGASRYVVTGSEGSGTAGEGETAATDEDIPEPATFVGAYGFVENLRADDGSTDGAEAEYVHAPSPQQATTAAILRSGHKNHEDDEAVRDLLDIDLSPGRVRAARHVLDAIRQGQAMSDVLGYRFERRLLERTRAYNEKAEEPGGPSDTINLVRYKWDVRRAYPSSEGKLDHGDVDPSLEDEAAESDVVDGYSLYKAWDEASDPGEFLSGVETEDGSDLETELGSAEREQLTNVLGELDAVVDAVTDLLITENVHQLGRGNFERAGGTIDDLTKGNAVPDPEVAETPRTDVGISHRQFVAFGAPGTEDAPDEWSYGTPAVSPDSLPPVSIENPQFGGAAAPDPTLQNRPAGEPNLNGWIGSLLPEPGRVSCEATFGWEEDRRMAVGTVAAPDAPGAVQVTDVGFEPDLVELTVAHGVGTEGLADATGTAGWSHGVAARAEDGIQQSAVSVDLDPGSGEGGAVVESDAALRVLLHDADGPPDGLTADLSFVEEGFELDVSAFSARTRMPAGLTVQYRAYQLGNPVGVDVGHKLTPGGTGSTGIDVDVDADAVTLLGTTVATGTDASEGATGTVGLSSGMAVRDPDGPPTQHAVGAGVDAGSGDAVAGARDDRALLFPYVSGGSASGTTSAEVTSMGSTIDLNVTDAHAGGEPDASRMVTYVAVQFPETVPAPSVATVSPGSLSAGEEVTVPTGERAGAIEVLAAPGLDGVGTATSVETAGWSHGVATGVGAQQALAHGYRPDADAREGGLAKGDVVRVPAIGSDGSIEGETVLRVVSVGASDLTLKAVSVGAGSPVLLVRAWPRSPETVTHAATTGATLDDLRLSPLDALHLAQPRDEAGASELEKRFDYYLSRHRPASDPPVPDRASLELAFKTLAPDADGEDPLTVAEFLEVARTIREVLGDGRALTAEDLGHPGEGGDDGYTDASAIELADRALAGQRTLAAAGEFLENRVARFDVGEDEATVTEAVATLREAVAEFREAVPVDGARHVGERVDAALDDDRDALHADLEAVRPHLPAGATDPDAVPDATTTVFPLAGQRIGVAVDPNVETTVHVWSTSGVDRFEETVDVSPDGDVEATVEVDFSGVRPGTPFAVAAVAGGAVLDARDGQVVLPPEDLVASPAAGERIRVLTDAAAGTTVTVTVASLDGTEYANEGVDTDDFGGASVFADLSAVEPWTFFEVTVEENGSTVADERGYVAGDPGGAIADGEVLPGLLWLVRQADAFDPYEAGTPAGALHRLLDSGDVDFDAVREELALVRDLVDATPGEPPTDEDADTIAAIVDEGDGDPALESLDLTALDAAVLGAGTELERLDLPELFGTSGRPDRAGGLRFFANRETLADDRLQDRLAAGIERPALLTDDELSAYGFCPSLSRFLAEEAAANTIREVDAGRLRAYLAAFAEWLPEMVADLGTTLSDPVGFAKGFEQLVHDPESFPTGAGRNAFRADFRRLTRTPVLDGVAVVDDLLADADVDGGFYNVDGLLLDLPGGPGGGGPGGGGPGGGGPGGGTPPFGPGGGGTPPGSGSGLDSDEVDLLQSYLSEDASALQQLRSEGFAPELTPQGTGVSDLRFHLELFRRRLLDPYLERLDSGDLPPEESDSKAAFGDAVRADAASLASTVTTQAEHLATARGPGRFDRAFRRGVLETVRRALRRVSYFEVYASTPNSTRGGTADDEATLLAQAETVLRAVKSTHATVRDLAPPRDAGGTVTDPPSVDSQVERLEALYGEEFTVLPEVDPANGTELTATFGRGDDILGGDPLAAETWFQRIARVRDRTATFRRALSYAEAVTGDRHRDLSVGQLPHRPTEEWVGLVDDDPEPGRVSLVAQFGAAFDGDFSGPVTGLFVDEHVENVPGATETSSVALNYDDPDTSAPNGVLLAVPPEEGWSRRALESVVTDGIEQFKLRLVDLQDLEEFYQLLPMVYLPDNSALQPDAPTVDTDRIRRYYDIAPEQWASYEYRARLPAVGMIEHMGFDGGGG